MNKQNKNNSKYLPTSRRTRKEDNNKNHIIAALIGFGIFIICHLTLSFLGSLIIAKGSDPDTLVPFVSTISMTVSSIVGALVTARITGGNAVVSSLMFLGAVFLCVLVISVIYLKDDNTPLWASLLLKAPVILGGFFGGYIGSHKKKPKSLYAKYK